VSSNPVGEALVEQARERLRQVMDPELGVNIVDLGLVESLHASAEGLWLRMTLTSAACPMAESLLDEVEASLQALLPAPLQLDIELVFDPPWTPARMSAAARAQLGWGESAP
jgi:metal-sulfur cluster biosynthetic enzyme